jgi:hypothetical protein
MSATAKPPEIAAGSVSDTLAARQVKPETGLTHAEANARRKEHGYNEVAEKKGLWWREMRLQRDWAQIVRVGRSPATARRGPILR